MKYSFVSFRPYFCRQSPSVVSSSCIVFSDRRHILFTAKSRVARASLPLNTCHSQSRRCCRDKVVSVSVRKVPALNALQKRFSRDRSRQARSKSQHYWDRIGYKGLHKCRSQQPSQSLLHRAAARRPELLCSRLLGGDIKQ